MRVRGRDVVPPWVVEEAYPPGYRKHVLAVDREFDSGLDFPEKLPSVS